MRGQVNILLVEDDPVDVMAVKRAFKHNKVTNPLYVAGDGEEALAFLQRKGRFADPASSPRPGVILLDIKLPRVDGHQLLQIMKSDPELLEIPVVVLTSSAEESDVRGSFRGGAAGYIVKPVTFPKFAEAIATFDLYWALSELP